MSKGAGPHYCRLARVHPDELCSGVLLDEVDDGRVAVAGLGYCICRSCALGCCGRAGQGHLEEDYGKYFLSVEKLALDLLEWGPIVRF